MIPFLFSALGDCGEVATHFAVNVFSERGRESISYVRRAESEKERERETPQASEKARGAKNVEDLGENGGENPCRSAVQQQFLFSPLRDFFRTPFLHGCAAGAVNAPAVQPAVRVSQSSLGWSRE